MPTAIHAPKVSPQPARAALVAPRALACAVCGGPLPPGRREACSGKCRAALSRQRWEGGRHRRDEELRTLLRRALRLLEGVKSVAYLPSRRAFVRALGGSLLAAPLAAEAQQARKVWRVGYFGLNSAPEVQGLLEHFRAGLRERGWKEGENLVIEYRWAEGKIGRVPTLAEDIVRAGVDVIVTPTEPTIIPVSQVTATIPIVMVAATDPVGSRLIRSLAHPGGNITGLVTHSSELGPKRLELLRHAIPRLSRVAILWNGDNQAKSREIVETADAARQLGFTAERIPVRGVAPDLRGAFSIMQRRKIQATIVLGDAYIFGHRQAIAALATSGRIPTMWELRAYVDTGGLMAYGPDLNELFRRSATYVDRILRGTKPADLPVEQPTKFELAINLKTAKALGLTIPPSLLARADQVIE